MKRKKLAFAVLVGLMVAPGLALAQFGQNSPPIPVISVSGTAEIKIRPDQVYLDVGVTVRNKTLQVAKQENDERVAGVLKVLKERGVDAKDMQTALLSVNPEYENQRSATPEVYMVARSIGIRIRDVGSFEKILTEVLQNGANVVGGIEFRTTELQKCRREARELAIRAAKEKAEVLAGQLGVEVGKVQSISETAFDGYVGGRGCYNVQNVVQSSFSNEPTGDDTLAVGQMTVTATVNVQFRIE